VHIVVRNATHTKTEEPPNISGLANKHGFPQSCCWKKNVQTTPTLDLCDLSTLWIFHIQTIVFTMWAVFVLSSLLSLNVLHEAVEWEHPPTHAPTTWAPTRAPSRAPTSPTGAMATTNSASGNSQSSSVRAVIGVFVGLIGAAFITVALYCYFLLRWRERKQRSKPAVAAVVAPAADSATAAPTLTGDTVSASAPVAPVSTLVYTSNPMLEADDTKVAPSSDPEDATTIDLEADGAADGGIRLSQLSQQSSTPASPAIATADADASTSTATATPPPVENVSPLVMWLQETKSKVLSDPHVVEAQEFYTDNRTDIEACIRVAMVALHIINMATSMAFYIRLPTCCNHNANQIGGTSIPAVAMTIAIVNLIHVLKCYPVLTASHFYLTNVYEIVCVVNAIFMVLILGYGSLSSYLISLCSSLYALGFTWRKTFMTLWRIQPFTCWTGWVVLNHVFSLGVNLLQIILIIIGLANTPYGTGYYFRVTGSGRDVGDTDVIPNAWQVNRPLNRDALNNLFANCTASFVATSSSYASQGGAVTQYCALAASHGSLYDDQAHGCCRWEMFG
jgi:hypothetical protein